METEKCNYGSRNRGTAVYILVYCLISNILMHCSGHVSVSLSQIVQSNMIEIHQQCPAFASFFALPWWTAFSVPWNISKAACLWETLSDSTNSKLPGHLGLPRTHQILHSSASSSFFLLVSFFGLWMHEFFRNGIYFWRMVVLTKQSMNEWRQHK